MSGDIHQNAVRFYPVLRAPAMRRGGAGQSNAVPTLNGYSCSKHFLFRSSTPFPALTLGAVFPVASRLFLGSPVQHHSAILEPSTMYTSSVHNNPPTTLLSTQLFRLTPLKNFSFCPVSSPSSTFGPASSPDSLRILQKNVGGLRSRSAALHFFLLFSV